MLIVIGFILSIKVVYADNFLDYLFRPFGGINVASFYDNYWYAIDFILYLVVFLGTTRVALEKRFKGRGGQALIIVLGIMLTIAMTWFADSVGFRLADLWPIAAGIFIAIIALLIFRLKSEQGAKLGKGVATAYVITFLTVQAIMPELCGPDGWIAQKMPIAWGIANILFLVAIAYMMGELGRWFSHGRKVKGREDWPIRRRERPEEWRERHPEWERPPGEEEEEERRRRRREAGEEEPGEPTPPEVEWDPEIVDINHPPFMRGRIRERRRNR